MSVTSELEVAVLNYPLDLPKRWWQTQRTWMVVQYDTGRVSVIEPIEGGMFIERATVPPIAAPVEREAVSPHSERTD